MLLIALLLILATMTLAGFIRFWLRIRRTYTRTIVQTLALTVGQNLPLGATLRSAARHERGRLREVFESLGGYLEAGAPLGWALPQAYPPTPPSVVAAIQAGEQGGTLPSILRTLAADFQRERHGTDKYAQAILYFFALLFAVGPVALALVVFLTPKFRDILLDFGVPMPAAQERLVSFVDFVLQAGPLLTMLTAVALVLCGWALYRVVRPHPTDNTPILTILKDTIVWYTPGLRRIVEVQALTRQLPIMQAAVRNGRDILDAVQQAAAAGTNFHARRRMRLWARRIESGGEPAEQARVLGIPAPLRRALETACGPDDLASALDYLCSYYRSLRLHWEHMFASAAIPVVVLIWAAGIAYVALAVFTPIYAIMDALMVGTY